MDIIGYNPWRKLEKSVDGAGVQGYVEYKLYEYRYKWISEGETDSDNGKAIMSAAVCEDANNNRVVRILKAVAHPVRLKIVALLCEGDRHVSALSEELDINQAIISQQLRILRMSGLVDASREGGFAVYRLTELHLKDLVACMEKCCTGQDPQ